MKRIPSGFQLGPHWITVRAVSQEEMRDAARKGSAPVSDKLPPPLGLSLFDEHTILIQKPRKGLSKQLRLHTFWHEYFHMLFHCVGRERLSYDEILVDNCGAMQLQMMDSAEF